MPIFGPEALAFYGRQDRCILHQNFSLAWNSENLLKLFDANTHVTLSEIISLNFTFQFKWEDVLHISIVFPQYILKTPEKIVQIATRILQIFLETNDEYVGLEKNGLHQ